MSNETELILLCSRLDISGPIQDKIAELLTYPIDWDKVKEISGFHHLMPILYYNLNKIPGNNSIPSGVFELMKETHYTNLYKNDLFEKEILHLIELSKLKNTKIIFLKGFALMRTLYQNPGLRMMYDVDILVEEKDLEKIRDIFGQLDYEGCAEKPWGLNRRYETEVNFFKKLSLDFGINIDAHWKLLPSRPYKLKLPLVWNRVKKVNFYNQDLFCLSQEDAFLFLALHIRRHVRGLTLNFVVDIAELLNQHGDNLDWLYIKNSARKNHFITSVYFSLYLAKELFETNIPPRIIKRFKPNIIKRIIIKFLINKRNLFDLTNRKGVIIRFLLFDSLIDFFIYLWRVSFLERFVSARLLKDK